ncbi:NAD+ kinase [Purpureocillium lavendulum]|uniref:NAD+ kinase n=1 Tax=Purpureocillium lavendulum TaxID=1247861 RepID=A0AB34FHZ6_9HYPO|nr:NAD+ kinase [Purpureocillium lavendulum]
MDGGDGADKARDHEKHATFSVDPPSDDDSNNTLEVTFDPANPYRRKSSLVSSEAAVPVAVRPSRRDQCIVHQFLASQRRAKDGDADASHFRAHPKVTSPEKHVSENGNGRVRPEGGLADDLVEPKHERRQSRAMVDPSSLEKDVSGQPDQQAWTREMTKTMSELDLTQSRDEVHSRMLTKKQLSDMAWGVRELSRRLSSMRIRITVKTIFLITKIYDQDLVPKTRDLTRWLLDADRDVEYVVYVEDNLRTNKKFDVAGLLDEVAHQHAARRGGTGDHEVAAARASLSRRLRYWDEAICKTRPHTFDLVITLGGDGTVLYASWLFQRIVPPVLSFSLGSLGFLTKFDFAEYEGILTSAFTKGVTVSLRLRFEATVMRSIKRKPSSESSEEDEDEHHNRRDLVEELIGEEREDAHTHRPDGTFEVLNEIVVDRGPNATMSFVEIFGDDEHFTSVLADGICVSTPTGSTAYNLAAGGSLCHPENPVMLVTSICPHTLSFRPIVLPDTIVLRIGVPYDARTASWASFDGRERVELHRGDYVTISASRYPFASVQAEGRRSEDWINSISGKLGWNTRQKQKGFKEWDK